MMPPTSIDGTDITGATIDGQDVQEITVDGDTVFSAVPDPVAQSDLVAWYPFRSNTNDVTAGDSNFGDTTDYSCDSVFGSVTSSSGVNDPFVNSNPSDSYDSTNGGASQPGPIWSNGYPISFTAWVNFDVTPDYDWLFDHRIGNPGGNTNINFSTVSNRGYDLRIQLSSSGNDYDYGGFNLNQWYHFAVTANNSTGKLYINGVEETSLSVGSNTGGSLASIGAPDDNLTGLQIKGNIDDVRYYETELSSTQVDTIYENTDPN